MSDWQAVALIDAPVPVDALFAHAGLVPSLTADEWQRHEYHPPGIRGLLFDDLDRIIQGMTPVPVFAATWTAEEQP